MRSTKQTSDPNKTASTRAPAGSSKKPASGKSFDTLVDNRAVSIAQRKHQAQADVSDSKSALLAESARSPIAQRFQDYQAAADASPRVTRQAQLQNKVNHSINQITQRKRFDGSSIAVMQQQAMEDEEPLQGKFNPIQQQAMEEDEIAQGKFTSCSTSAQLQTDHSDNENRTGMPTTLKSGLEGLSGMDLSDVKVHYNSSKPAQLNALAYAQGTDIHLGPGQETHLPHEAWHVVQQRQGRVDPTLEMNGQSINDDAHLETEADQMGRKALE